MLSCLDNQYCRLRYSHNWCCRLSYSPNCCRLSYSYIIDAGSALRIIIIMIIYEHNLQIAIAIDRQAVPRLRLTVNSTWWCLHAGAIGQSTCWHFWKAYRLLWICTTVWVSSTPSDNNGKILNESVAKNITNGWQKLELIRTSSSEYATNVR